MDMTVYPEFDVSAELDRAVSNVEYHKAQVRYFQNQVEHLRRAQAEQMELQRVYGRQDVEFDVSEIDVSFIADARIDPSRPLPQADEVDEVDLSAYAPDDGPEPGYV